MANNAYYDQGNYNQAYNNALGGLYNSNRYVYWEFYWAGWRATGHELQRNGWEFTSYRSERTFSDMIVIEQKGVASFVSGHIDDIEARHHQHSLTVPIGLRHVGREVIINGAGAMPIAVPLDMSPISEHEWYRIKHTEFSPFKVLIAKEQQRIIIPQEPSVEEMLDKIIKMQQPAQVEYFNKKVKENKMPQATLTAQIIQLRETA